MNSISVIGLGKMGSALASTLLDAGYRVMGQALAYRRDGRVG